MPAKKYHFEQNADGKLMNPETSLPFKYGDVFEGKIFIQKQKNGRPMFQTPESFAKRLETQKVYDKKRCGVTRNIRTLSSFILSWTRTRAKKHGGICTLTKEWVRNEIERGYRVGDKFIGAFQIHATGTQSAWAPSIDRIDSSNRDYTIENCQVVPWALNCARNKFSDDILLEIVGPYVDHLRAQRATVDSTMDTDMSN